MTAKTALRSLLILLMLPIAASVGFMAIGPERVYTWIAGPADQGAVDFATLQRRTRPTDSLACSPALCRIRVDLALPIYADTPAVLMGRLDSVLLADSGNLVRVDDGTRPAYRRYVARTAAMRFPDTIDAEAQTLAGGSGLMIYGRSQLGTGDWGVNLSRHRGWAAALAIIAEPVKGPPTS